jgi:hypothetical protein
MKKPRRLTSIRLAVCGALAVAAVATTTTAASADSWVHWKSEKYGQYLYSRANGNGARFGLGSNSAKNIYDIHLSNGHWVEVPYNGTQCMEVNGSNGNLDTWSCAFSNQSNEQWDEVKAGVPGNSCWNLQNVRTDQLVDADAASGNLVGVSHFDGWGCGGLLTERPGYAWK